MSTAPTPALHEGRVKWYSVAHGYGFLSPDETPSSTDGDAVDVFIHHSVVGAREDLVPGERVLFTIEEGPKGLLATRLERLE
ncbi:MAG: cold shock domain-containing protein [Acidobacteriota bacterium]